METAAIVFLVNVVSSVVKRWIYPKFGKIGVQVLVFAASVVGALYWTYRHEIPGLEAIVIQAAAIFVIAVSFYEVILQHIPFFKAQDPNQQ